MGKHLARQLAKHNLRGQQAQWTAAEARAWARKRHDTIGLWPSAKAGRA